MDAPQVRITLDHMRHTLIHAFGQHTEEMQRAFDAAVTAAVEAFDYAGEVRRMTHVAIAEQMALAIKAAIYEPEVQMAINRVLARNAKKLAERMR